MQAPASRHPRLESLCGNAIRFSGLPSNLPVRQSVNARPVRRLRGCRCPSTVSRLVIPVAIDPINREIVGIAIRHRPVAKSGKLRPFWTYRNTLSAIPFETPLFWVGAALAHPMPDPEQSGLRPSVGRLDLYLGTPDPASARGGPASAEVATSGDFYRAALAVALPKKVSVGLPAIATSERYDGQHSKRSARQIFHFSHNQIYQIWPAKPRLLAQEKIDAAK